MSNSFMNGIIYSWISPKFRDEVKGLLCKWINSKNKINKSVCILLKTALNYEPDILLG